MILTTTSFNHLKTLCETTYTILRIAPSGVEMSWRYDPHSRMMPHRMYAIWSNCLRCAMLFVTRTLALVARRP